MQYRVVIRGDYLCVDHNCELGVQTGIRLRNSKLVYEVEIVLLHSLIVHGCILNVNYELRLVKCCSWVVLGYLSLPLSGLCLDSHTHILD